MKVSIIGGGGLVGSMTAYALQCGGVVSSICLIDANKDLALGQATDLLHGASLAADQRISAGEMADVSSSNIVIITAGLRRKPDESRLDLINRNVDLFLGLLDELKAGARVEPGEFKRHPADFALWKRAKPGEPSWDSPWGPGRPGWHIECSAMSLKYLRMGFDIHGGGDDLIFPHHENEIAQSEAYMGTSPFARYWIHNAMVNVGGEKMAKSLHNYFAATDALKRYPPDVIRYALGSAHYRKPIEIDQDRLEDAARAVDRLRAALASVEAVARRADTSSAGGGPSQGMYRAAVQARAAFEAAMDDDLNTSKALAAVFDLVVEVNRVTDLVLKGNERPSRVLPGLIEARDVILELTGILGLRLAKPSGDTEIEQQLRELAVALKQEAGHLFAATPGPALDDLVAYILAGRERARASKDFATADRIRKQLADAGVVVEDLPTGPRWRLATLDARYAILDAGDDEG